MHSISTGAVGSPIILMTQTVTTKSMAFVVLLCDSVCQLETPIIIWFFYIFQIHSQASLSHESDVPNLFPGKNISKNSTYSYIRSR